MKAGDKSSQLADDLHSPYLLSCVQVVCRFHITCVLTPAVEQFSQKKPWQKQRVMYYGCSCALLPMQMQRSQTRSQGPVQEQSSRLVLPHAFTRYHRNALPQKGSCPPSNLSIHATQPAHLKQTQPETVLLPPCSWGITQEGSKMPGKQNTVILLVCAFLACAAARSLPERQGMLNALLLMDFALAAEWSSPKGGTFAIIA